MIKSMGAGFSSAYSHFASSGLSSTSQASSSVVDGNYSFSNMQTDNVSGNSWSTNSSTAFGQMSRQLANGGMQTQTGDGTTIWDSRSSKLPVEINVSRQLASANQQMARESDVQAESALHGYNSSVTSAWNSLKQFGTNMGTSASTTSGADNTESSQDSMARSKMWSAVVSNAKANNISNEESFQQLMDDSLKELNPLICMHLVNGVPGTSCLASLVSGARDYLLKLVVKEALDGVTAQVILIMLALPVGNHMTAGMTRAVRRRKTSRKLPITLPAVKRPTLAILPITMPALAWISLPHHFPVRKTATTSIQTAVHAAMNTVKWLHVLKV
jgi:hypothetical protein